MEKTYCGVCIPVNDEGYLTNRDDWNRMICVEIAQEEGIDMTDEHFAVVEYLRDQHAAGVALSIRGIKKSGVVNIKDMYRLFPGGPLKKASKIAGIPKPVSCI